MSDPIRLGKTTCDFLAMDEFLRLAQTWLHEDQLRHVVTLNAEMVVLAETHSSFREAVADADIRVPDSAGLFWARWYMRSQAWQLIPSLLAFLFRPSPRVSGVDIVRELSKQAGDKPIYLLGGSAAQNDGAAHMLRKLLPTQSIITAPHHAFDASVPESLLHDIATHRPALLFVAYGAPNQTLWINQHKQTLEKSGVRIAIGVGGAFAMISEHLPRAPYFLRRFNLEWLWRLILQPRRLPRIWTAVVRFPLLIHKRKH